MIKNDLKTLMNVARARRGLSLRKMADLMNNTPAYISAIENGKCNIPADYFSRICEALKLEEMEKIEIFTVIAEMQSGCLQDSMTEEEKGILRKIYEFFERIKNGIKGNISSFIDETVEMLKNVANLGSLSFV